MHIRLPALGFILLGLLASCAQPEVDTIRPLPQTPPPAAPMAAPLFRLPPPPTSTALTTEGYKKEFALRLAHISPDVFHDALPKVLKSVVVVEVTLTSDGRLAEASIRRSNGYKNLENIALNSVRRAAPFTAPPRSMRRSDGSVNFLETFLFRDDGRFQIRTLAEAQ